MCFDRQERFELYVILIFLLILVCLRLQLTLSRYHSAVLYEHEKRIAELETYNDTSPLEAVKKDTEDE
jgi:hypothetical protein